MQFELQILSRLVHSNIVRVYGGSMTPPNLFVVAELMNGDLNSFIHKRGPNSTPLTLRSVLSIALDIVKGLVSRGIESHGMQLLSHLTWLSSPSGLPA